MSYDRREHDRREHDRRENDSYTVFEYDYLFKIILIGDSGVGKTALMLRFSDRTFSDTYVSTIGVDFKIKTITIDGIKVKLQIWDTASQKYFYNVASIYYKSCHGAILVFDVTEKDSFTSIDYWNSEANLHNARDMPKIMVGTKCDLARRYENGDWVGGIRYREISTEEAKKKAFELHLPYFETSSKYISDAVHQTSVDDVFIKFIRMLIEREKSRGNFYTVQNDESSSQTLLEKCSNTCSNTCSTKCFNKCWC